MWGQVGICGGTHVKWMGQQQGQVGEGWGTGGGQGNSGREVWVTSGKQVEDVGEQAEDVGGAQVENEWGTSGK